MADSIVEKVQKQWLDKQMSRIEEDFEESEMSSEKSQQSLRTKMNRLGLYDCQRANKTFKNDQQHQDLSFGPNSSCESARSKFSLKSSLTSSLTLSSRSKEEEEKA